MLDTFALIVLILLIGLVIAGWLLLAMWPGQIAKRRNHPQAEAINVMGWWGAITMGVLSPVAWVWAYTNPAASLSGGGPATDDPTPGHEEEDTP